MWIREGGVSHQFLNGLHSTSRPFLHVHRSGRRVYNNPWPRETMAPSCYFSFVNRAVLWDRGSHHHTASMDVLHNVEPQPPCSRFEAHMRACPGLIRPPYFPRTHRLPRPPMKILRVPKLPRQQETRRKQNSLQHFSVMLPSVPASPHPSVASRDPLRSPTPSVHSGTKPDKFQSFHVPSPNSEHTTIKQEDVVSHREVSLTGPSSPQIDYEDDEEPKCEAVTPMTMTPGTPSTPVTPLTPMTPMTPDSLSDLSRPASSQFSYSTNLNSSLSNAPSVNQTDDSDGEDGDAEDGDDINNDDLEACSSSLSDLCFSSLDGAVLASCSPPTSSQSSFSKNLSSLSQEPRNTSHRETLKETPIIQVEDPLVRETPHPNQLTHTSVNGAPSPCSAYPDSQSRLASASQLDVRSDWTTCRWPILPPITPQRGSQGSRASLSSPISCSQSDMFAELEATAPRSVSCQSLDHADCSDMEITSPTTDLSPGLAALTVGCDSGDLGSLSRVQLLLLERGTSEGLEPLPDLEWNSPIEERGDYEPGLQVWSLGIPQHYQCTDPYAQVSSSVSLSVRHFPLGQVDITSGTPGEKLSDAEDISRSSSWSLSCASRENTPWEEEVTAQSGGSDVMSDADLHPSAQPTEPRVTEGTSQKAACPGKRERPVTGVRRGPNQIKDRRRRHHRKMLGEKGEERKSKALQIYTRLRDGNKPTEPSKPRSCSRFEDFDFLAKYCIISPEKLAAYRRAFEAVDSDGDGYLSCFQVLLALKEIIPPELLTEEEEIYVYRILELVDFSVTEGLTDLRLFAVVASLAQKIATLDDFMRSLISKMDFKSLEMKLYKAKQLFLFLLEGQSEGSEAPQGRISAEQLLVELKAGGIREEQEEEVRRELRSLRSLDLLDFLAHLPLFILIHNSVIANPLDDSSNL
ncbi:uncharacterized protein LOC108279443 isoform X3 [Ictalurus punctatus]|uniref:Uncharacterized protein LOC108279443 isoform X3 n=1 Tax=Ictalurus punctatus TaxID=7998 RepID=A0A2D0T2Z5_ICTPU|nr:uncharacterized protein LOC108279443 isoform X3 [Ictalurus punctatus]